MKGFKNWLFSTGVPFFSSRLTGYSLMKSLNPQERKSMGLHLHLSLHGMGMRIGTSYRLPPGSALPVQFFPESYNTPSTTSPPPPPPVRPTPPPTPSFLHHTSPSPALTTKHSSNTPSPLFPTSRILYLRCYLATSTTITITIAAADDSFDRQIISSY